MLRNLLFLLFVAFAWTLSAQESGSPYKSKKIAVSDTVRIDSVSINKVFFKLLDSNGNPVDTTFFAVDFSKSMLTFRNGYSNPDSLTVRYLKYPEYLTRKYSIYDQNRVLDNESALGNLYKVSRDPLKKFVPFEGLATSGSITRGVTIGNNQNAVVNSNLDLQITGKLSDKISLRASIQDSNIPLQEGGYSQKLDEFDQIFIEVAGERWTVRAGDLFMENRQSRFLNFNKKVQGLSGTFAFGKPNKKTTIFASAALVRGQYARSSFTGQEGNQGPYKLRGPNGELYVLVVSGSERVFVNGILLKRGENNDYIIDYNAGEIIFTSLFPITSEMRINIEYQYSDRNYTRFVAYGGAVHEEEKWSLGGFVYSESDIKNQPLQQNLSTEQATILAAAGDDPALMTAPSVYPDSYSANKILYRKIIVDGIDAFEYSNNPDDELFNVRFTLVGNNLGNYVLASSAAIGKIYQYVSPVDGVRQGNYEPITRLVPPTKIQIATMLGKYSPSEKTAVDFEFGASKNDKNLFSSIDDDDNTGIAAKINTRQRLFSRKWKTDAFANYQYVAREFRTIERLFTIEFNRDWNLLNPIGNQSLLVSGIETTLLPLDASGNSGFAKYQFEKLDFSENFSGSRHVIDAVLKLGKWDVRTSESFLNSNAAESDSKFIRSYSQAKFHFGKNWVGGSLKIEDNRQKLTTTGQYTALSQKFSEWGAFAGRGDSTKVFVETGFLARSNDSLRNGFLQRVNNSQSYYVKSKLIQNEKTDLSIFANYRILKFSDPALVDEPSLNSRLLYNDKFFKQLLQTTIAYETSSGTIAQQEFTYLEVDPGQGVYTWNDYNGNGIQELEEFEVAPFPDQAIFVRVFLPNQVFVKTHQNKFSQSLTINPGIWQNNTGFRKFLSYFYDQASFSVDRKIRRENGNFNLDPFSNSAGDDLLGLNSGFRNSIYYNRGKQDHSVTYTYLQNKARTLLSIGTQASENSSHQLQYTHLYKKHWLFTMASKTIFAAVSSENFPEKNYEVDGWQLAPRISYIFSKNAAWDVFYEFQQKVNQLIGDEELKQDRIGTAFTFASEKKLTMNGEFSYYKNAFTGNSQSPVAFQMLEGLQPGENMTWRLLLQKNLTQYLDVNVNYQGRKSETSRAIHTGSIQLRAFF
ncbi:MAG: hypothetical protein EOO51_03830 [Flavobacterium sp.]|nr:MAG: hypothetical protein EOO51_03830 [Flavobacterium sp.]